MPTGAGLRQSTKPQAGHRPRSLPPIMAVVIGVAH
jgi:hypothetical protein